MLSKCSSAVSTVMMNAHSFIFILFSFARYLHYGLSNNAEQRIINGIDTDIKLVPFILSLRKNGTHVCGAVIIDQEWALTAAHCVATAKDSFKEITLCSGSSILDENCIVHKVANLFVHENFNNVINDNDIALIKVTPAFIYNDYNTKAVDLAPHGHINTKWGLICGWGQFLKFNGMIEPILSKNLRCAVVPRVNKKLCQWYYATRFIVTSRMTCYGFREGIIDACQGDSGGPIVNMNNILLGLTSWGDGCAEKYSPGVYTDVTLFIHWIREKMRSDA